MIVMNNFEVMQNQSKLMSTICWCTRYLYELTNQLKVKVISLIVLNLLKVVWFRWLGAVRGKGTVCHRHSGCRTSEFDSGCRPELLMWTRFG